MTRNTILFVITMFVISLLMTSPTVSSHMNAQSTPNNFNPGSTIIVSENFHINNAYNRHEIPSGDLFAFNIVHDRLYTAEYGTSQDILAYDSETGQYLESIDADTPSIGEILHNGSHHFVLSVNGYVDLYNNDWIKVGNFSAVGSGPGEADVSWDMQFTEDEVFLVDNLNNQIDVWDQNGNFISNHSISEVTSPFGIAVTEEAIFVTDISNDDVSVYNASSYEFIRTLNLPLVNPRDIDFHNGLFYLANVSNTLVYDRNFNLKQVIDQWGGNEISPLFKVGKFGDSLLMSSDLANRGIYAFKTDVFRVNAQSGVDRLRVSWANPENPSVNAYNIWRGTSPTNLAVVDTVSSDANAYIDTVVQRGVEYYYSVTALTDNGQTDLSNIVSANIDPITVTVDTTVTIDQTINDTLTNTETFTLSEEELVPWSLWILPVALSLLIIIRSRKK